ncbi:MAG TPA: magnesium transporter CorA family protein [Chthonomonadaceae bacterium]|nr:magnesium transporter CorA family protein [Chthonomonadaceae bacterium]
MPRLQLRKRPAPTETLPLPAGQITVLLRRPGSDHPEQLPPEQISDVLPIQGALLWVDIRNPGPSELAMLREEFDFTPLSLEDIAKQRQRPKVDEYPGYYFLVMYAPLRGRDRELETTEVDLFVGRNYIVSLHKGEVPALDEAERRWERARPDLRDRVGFLAHIVVDAMIDSYFPVVDDIDDRLERLDWTMFRGNASANPAELLALKHSLFELRKAIYPLREAFQEFPRREHSLFDLETHPYFQDVYDHILRLLDIVDIQRDMIAGALDAHLAFLSNSLNETMKILTVVGICEAAAGAMFGAWGMNVKGVPFAHVTVGGVEIGFWLVCGITTVIIALTLYWLKRRGMW